MTFLLFEISCRKVKRLDQSQDYFHLIPKRFLEVGGNRVFGQSSKNLFKPFLCSSSSYSYFVSKRVLLYQSECVRVFPFSIVSKFFQQYPLKLRWFFKVGMYSMPCFLKVDTKASFVKNLNIFE